MNNIKKKIYIISVKNEESGSCVSVKRLKKILEDSGEFNINFITSKGEFLQGEKLLIDTELNPIKILKNIFLLNFYFTPNKNDFLLFNSIISLPYLLFFLKPAKRAILIHELGLKPPWLYNLINFTINFFNIKVAVVNPYMKKIYKNSYLLQNFYSPKKDNETKKFDKQILKIANCNLKKGIKDFITMANKYPDYKFILLTHKELMEPDCAEEIKKAPKNLKIEFNQQKKEYLLKSSKYLLSLSYANETFGLVLLEAILNNTLPITVDNPGSRYCLNNSELIIEREKIINDFRNLDAKFTKNYNKLLNKIKKYVMEEFSEEKILENFKKIVEC